jgi:hypothetical protein
VSEIASRWKRANIRGYRMVFRTGIGIKIACFNAQYKSAVKLLQSKLKIVSGNIQKV